ncbi:MAG: arylsulfatase A-like enzyme [Halioglobus sp.]|jgi:arylsulfatase A-like enzyme
MTGSAKTLDQMIREAHKVLATMVAPIDIMPTLASTAGAPQPEGAVIDGVDLMPLVLAKNMSTRRIGL